MRLGTRRGDRYRLIHIYLARYTLNPLLAMCAQEALARIGAPIPVDCGVPDWMSGLLDKIISGISVSRVSLVYPSPPISPYIEAEYVIKTHSYVVPGIVEIGVRELGIEFRINGSQESFRLNLDTGKRAVSSRGPKMRQIWRLAGLPDIYHYIPYNGGLEDVSTYLSACIYSPITEHRNLECPRGVISHRLEDTMVETIILWPKGSRLPNTVTYPLVREVWVLQGLNRESVELNSKNTIPSGIYRGSPGHIFQRVLEQTGIECYRLETGYNGGKVYGCPPRIDESTATVIGPFLLLEGSAHKWDPDKAVTTLNEVSTAKAVEYALPPIAVLTEKPAILLPLTYGGPLGIQYYRGYGITKGKDGDVIATTTGRSIFSVIEDELIPLNYRIESELLKYAKMAYREDYKTTLWTVVDTPLGLRPGPPYSILQIIGFGAEP